MICTFLYCNSLYHGRTLAALCYFDQLQLRFYEPVNFKTCRMPKIKELTLRLARLSLVTVATPLKRAHPPSQISSTEKEIVAIFLEKLFNSIRVTSTAESSE